jgi:hypothetical protein
VSDDKEEVEVEVEPKPTALVPIESKILDFYGDKITAALVEVDDEQIVYVSLRPICEHLGLSWSAQLQRIRRDEVLNESLISVFITNTEIGQRGKGRRELISLPLKLLPGWLFGLEANRVKPELKEKIIRYRRECYDVLWRAFKEKAETMPFAQRRRPTTEWEPNSVLMQIRQQALAMAKLAEEQMEIEAKALEALDQAYYAHNRMDEFYQFFDRLDVTVGEIGQKVNEIDQKVDEIDQKVGEIEQIVRPGAIINEAQASVIVNTVKALAQYLITKEPGKNHYQGIFGELYRLYQVGEYRRVRQADYPAVLAFLDEWYRKAGGSGIPTQALMSLDPEPEA